MVEPKRQPLEMPPNPMLPPNPMRTLQGEEPGAPSRADLKALLLDLLQHDPEVRALLGTPPPAAPLEPDAATATFLVDLIEQTMYRTLRADAYRRPK
jgi:hypothetical protein